MTLERLAGVSLCMTGCLPLAPMIHRLIIPLVTLTSSRPTTNPSSYVSISIVLLYYVGLDFGRSRDRSSPFLCEYPLTSSLNVKLVGSRCLSSPPALSPALSFPIQSPTALVVNGASYFLVRYSPSVLAFNSILTGRVLSSAASLLVLEVSVSPHLVHANLTILKRLFALSRRRIHHCSHVPIRMLSQVNSWCYCWALPILYQYWCLARCDPS